MVTKNISFLRGFCSTFFGTPFRGLMKVFKILGATVLFAAAGVFITGVYTIYTAGDAAWSKVTTLLYTIPVLFSDTSSGAALDFWVEPVYNLLV